MATDTAAAVEYALNLIRTDQADGIIPAGETVDSLSVLAEYVDANTYALDTAEALGLPDSVEALAELDDLISYALEQSPL